jgi:hypothetical protein
MSDPKKRPPRFDEIIALSHQPPKKPAVSPYTLAYDAEEARKQEEAGLKKVTNAEMVRLTRQGASSAPAAPVEIPSSGGTTVVSGYHGAAITDTTATYR